jgi:hypothetical protein
MYSIFYVIIVISVILIFFLIKKQFKLFQKIDILQEQIENQSGKTDLELATVHQIVLELSKRPNYRFMFIVPHLSAEAEGQSLNVECHSSNVSIRMALDVLKATYEGVAQNIRHENPDEDIGDLED